MNDEASSAIPPEMVDMGSTPPTCFLIEVEGDLYHRFRIYITESDVSDRLLTKRLLNNALREFLDDHAPIEYPISPLEA
jgi:hypothetical protein